MKSIVCAALVLLLATLASTTQFKTGSPGNARVARGFRLGAADRFSHGFGKRDGSWADIIDSDSKDFALPNEEFAQLLRSSERLSNLLVDNTIDKNGDGFVTKDELLGYRK